LSLACSLVPTLLAQASEPTETSTPVQLSKGIGPVKELKLDPVNLEIATAGKKLFEAKCSACHKMNERLAAPALKGVTTRRAPEWIMNMILNPDEMIDKDPIAQELLGEYLIKMTFQNVTQDETRSVLEYFRYYDEKGEIQNVPSKDEKTNKKTDAKKPVNKKKK
jgi:hypothetical protein